MGDCKVTSTTLRDDDNIPQTTLAVVVHEYTHLSKNKASLNCTVLSGCSFLCMNFTSIEF
jgi:hypothetical protein